MFVGIKSADCCRRLFGKPILASAVRTVFEVATFSPVTRKESGNKERNIDYHQYVLPMSVGNCMWKKGENEYMPASSRTIKI